MLVADIIDNERRRFAGKLVTRVLRGFNINCVRAPGVGFDRIRVRLPSLMDPRRAGQEEHVPRHEAGWISQSFC